MSQIGKELKNISGERLEKQSEFIEYITDYYHHHDEYNIDVDSDYFDAIEIAFVNPKQGWTEYNNEWDGISSKIKVMKKKVEINPDFKFRFETEEELFDAKRTGYIDLCDVVRICVKYKNGPKVDSPYTSREEYIKAIDFFNSRKDVEIMEVYQDKWMWDSNDYI
jgi:hypothetical protein